MTKAMAPDIQSRVELYATIRLPAAEHLSTTLQSRGYSAGSRGLLNCPASSKWIFVYRRTVLATDGRIVISHSPILSPECTDTFDLYAPLDASIVANVVRKTAE